MTDRADDALLTMAFSLHSNPGAYAVLVGAGVSAPSVLTAWGVLNDLARQVAQLRGTEPADPIAWFTEEFGEAPGYESLLEKLAPTQLERQRLLRCYFEATPEEADEGRKQPTQAHRALARLVKAKVVRLIITLNFDRLIEQALREEGIEPTVAATPEDVAGLAPLHTIDCCVVHLHGDYLNPTSMRNTATELAAYAPAIDGLIERVLGDYGLIIAGWSSVYDPALRKLIAAHYPGRFSLAWIEPNEFPDSASELLTLKRGLPVTASADTAFGQLADAVAALQARGSRHPLTLPVAVETAKRELSGQRVAIGLHDTLAREFASLHALPDFHLSDHQSDAPYGGYEVMLDRIEEATRITSGLVATLAYWGTKSTDSWWLDELRRFAALSRGSGQTRLLSLRLVSGTLLFYSSGVAAVASGRYDLLTRMFKLQRENIYSGQRERLAEAFDADAQYDGSANRAGRSRAALAPILAEATGLGPSSLEDAWQIFELLRLASGAIRHPNFERLCSDFIEADKDLRSAQVRYDADNAAGKDTQAGQEARHAAWEQQGRLMGQLARLRSSGRPHILVRDLRIEESYQSDVALRVCEELEQEGSEHPLIRDGFCDSALKLSIAMRAVSTAVGMIGREQAWSRVNDHFGVIPSEIWVDTAMTPEESSS